MGVSTDGILVFGVDLGEKGEIELPWQDDEDGDFESWYVRLHGVSADHLWDLYYAWEKTPEAQALERYGDARLHAYEQQNPGWRDELNAYYAKKRAIEKEAPLEIVYHCSGDYLMLIAAVPGTITRAARGYPERIEVLTVDGAKVDAAVTFCATHKIPFENPGWLLASMWW